jgi:uncharacterized metal-binding protein YceD (DUF177 family)
MSNIERFKIDLKALAEEVTPLEWELDNQFFSHLEGAQLQEGSLHVSGAIRKSVGFYELELHTVGTVVVNCDRCLDPMDQPIDADLQLTVKLGVTNTEDDDVITVDETHPVLDTAWLIYESIALAVPIQHVHQPGDCNVAMSEKLKEFSAARSSDADAQTNIDPRWEALSKLKIEN